MSSYHDFNNAIIAEFRANEGKVGGPFEGGTLLLLNTTGAKSGKQRTNPLAYLQDGKRLIIIASKGGAPTNPDWYYNLLANPVVTLEVGTEQFQARATAVTEEPERSELYGKVAEVMPGFADYERNSTRKIPVVVLERVA